MMRGWILGALLAAWAGGAWAEGCPKDRTSLEMAGHVLCLPADAMPKVRHGENGEVTSLVWSNLDQLSSADPVPYGSIYLFIDSIKYKAPPYSAMEKSNLPDMKQISSPRYKSLYPERSRLWGNTYRIDCHPALNPEQKNNGGLDCEIIAALTDTLRARVIFVTGFWPGWSQNKSQAWPDLDENWSESWSGYIKNLEAGINNLISLQ